MGTARKGNGIVMGVGKWSGNGTEMGKMGREGGRNGGNGVEMGQKWGKWGGSGAEMGEMGREWGRNGRNGGNGCDFVVVVTLWGPM